MASTFPGARIQRHPKARRQPALRLQLPGQDRPAVHQGRVQDDLPDERQPAAGGPTAPTQLPAAGLDLPCTRIECDEIWSFCYAKQKNVPGEHRGEFGYGDVWTWTAVCADTKLVPSWLVAERTAFHAEVFMRDLASRLRNRLQLTTDGSSIYVNAVGTAFGSDINYTVLHKIYAAPTLWTMNAATAPPSAPALTSAWCRAVPPAQGEHVLCPKAKPVDADGHVPLHQAHQRLQQES